MLSNNEDGILRAFHFKNLIKTTCLMYRVSCGYLTIFYLMLKVEKSSEMEIDFPFFYVF